MLLHLLHESRCPELAVIPSKTPPKVSERNGCGMPKSMGIKKSPIRREVEYLQKHANTSSNHQHPQLPVRWMLTNTCPDSPQYQLQDSQDHANFHIPSCNRKNKLIRPPADIITQLFNLTTWCFPLQYA